MQWATFEERHGMTDHDTNVNIVPSQFAGIFSLLGFLTLFFRWHSWGSESVGAVGEKAAWSGGGPPPQGCFGEASGPAGESRVPSAWGGGPVLRETLTTCFLLHQAGPSAAESGQELQRGSQSFTGSTGNKSSKRPKTDVNGFLHSCVILRGFDCRGVVGSWQISLKCSNTHAHSPSFTPPGKR